VLAQHLEKQDARLSYDYLNEIHLTEYIFLQWRHLYPMQSLRFHSCLLQINSFGFYEPRIYFL